MPRPIRWLILSLGALFLLAVVGVAAITCRSHLHEGTYYGPHTDILRIGERVMTAQSTRGVVQSDPAWDEDSCDPDRQDARRPHRLEACAPLCTALKSNERPR